MNQIPSQYENGIRKRQPSLVFKFLAAVLPVVVAWWIWKPLGAYCAILTVGFYGARFIWTLSLLFGAGKISMIGCLWGIIMAGVVFLFASAAMNSRWAKAFLEIWGWACLYYIACPRPAWRTHIMAGDNKLQCTAGLAMIFYLFASGIIWFTVWLHR